ncbi:MAG: UDP-3-O-(3-hydroxymyristoyl)glucosamine N-acyltransferase [Pseudomonadota bacterium]|nr:UDP-3-O-(3-hydroxymyristoyl)glucosamine N-acyltransferase [Pseudomonadota bacterium]
MPKTYTTQQIAEAVDGALIGDGLLEIERVVHPADTRGRSDLILAVDTKLLPLLGTAPLHAVVVKAGTTFEPGFAEACIVVERPRLAMAKLTALFAEHVPVPLGVHPTAVVEEGAKIGQNVAIGAQAYVASTAVIGDNSVLHPQVYIGPNATIGRDALIYAGVKIGARVVIGERCIIHFNASIGSDGFSFVTPKLGSVEAVKGTGTVAAINDELLRIASLGAVTIGNDVEIGANTSIDRGTIAPTRIGNGTKIDNQVQIGHNVTIGENCLICGRTAIAGSATIGNRVVLGGGVGVADHVIVGDDAVAMALSGIGGNIQPRTVVGGFPAIPRDRVVENLRNISRIRYYIAKVDALAERLNALEEKTKTD